MTLPGFSTSLQQSIHQNYGLNVTAAAPVGTGAMSTTMQLITDQGELFLKCYRPPSDSNPPSPTDLPRITFAHAVGDFLRKSDLPVPRLLLNRVGGTYTVVDDRIYAISEFVEGYDYDAAEPGAALRAAGEVLGRFHQQLHGFQPPIEYQWRSMKEEIVERLRKRLERTRSVVSADRVHPVSQEQIDQWRQELEALAAALPVARDENWIIHGDYRAQNLKFYNDGHVNAILDLDTARPANRLFDLAYSLVFFPAVYQDTPLTPGQKSFFLHAYETVYPLSETERKLLPTHLRLAFLRGITLWLHLHDFGGMCEQTRPWIQGYLNNADAITEF